MNYKKVIFVIVLIFGFTLCLGCTDSNEGAKKSVESETVNTETSQANKEETQASTMENQSKNRS